MHYYVKCQQISCLKEPPGQPQIVCARLLIQYGAGNCKVAFKSLIEEFSCLQSDRIDYHFHRHHPQNATILRTKKRSRAECYEVFEALNMVENQRAVKSKKF